AEPDEESSLKLWNAWIQRADTENDCSLQPDEYLAIHRDTGISMRAIWNLTQRWNQYGDLTGRGSHATAERACSDG
ncbi:hypothetical protein DF186_21715, partial [Enterococcus hirae]